MICRRPYYKDELQRFVREQGLLREGAALPGRGVYLCENPECRKRFERKYVS